MKFVSSVLTLCLILVFPAFACAGSANAGHESTEAMLARTVFNRISPDSAEIDAAAKRAYGCRYIFADVMAGLDRATPIAGGLPQAPLGPDGSQKHGKVVVAYIITATGMAGDPVVLESSDPQLTAAALSAMEQWRFKPALFNGQVVASLAAQEFTFGPTGP